MSEYLVNQKQEELKGIIKKLHDGASVDEVKKSFDQLIRNVSPEEIASMEQALIDEGSRLRRCSGCATSTSRFLNRR